MRNDTPRLRPVLVRPGVTARAVRPAVLTAAPEVLRSAPQTRGPDRDAGASWPVGRMTSRAHDQVQLVHAFCENKILALRMVFRKKLSRVVPIA